MAIQIGDVQHSNALEKTVIFSIMKARYNNTNLRLCLESFLTDKLVQ